MLSWIKKLIKIVNEYDSDYRYIHSRISTYSDRVDRHRASTPSLDLIRNIRLIKIPYEKYNSDLYGTCVRTDSGYVFVLEVLTPIGNWVPITVKNLESEK